jgi:hypothetical protein
MGKWPIIGRIYGYVVCLIAISVALWSVGVLVQAVFDLGDPMHASRAYEYGSHDLSSFEAFKLDVLRSGGTATKQYVPDDKTLRAMYKAARGDRIAFALRRARIDLVVRSLLIVVCIALFATHWKWLHKPVTAEG